MADDETEARGRKNELSILRVARELDAYRDELIAEVERWDRDEHPLAIEQARYEARFGTHWRVDTALKQATEYVEWRRKRARERLRRFGADYDRIVSKGRPLRMIEKDMRPWLSDGLDHTGGFKHSKEVAQRAVCEYLRDAEKPAKKRMAVQALLRLYDPRAPEHIGEATITTPPGAAGLRYADVFIWFEDWLSSRAERRARARRALGNPVSGASERRSRDIVSDFVKTFVLP